MVVVERQGSVDVVRVQGALRQESLEDARSATQRLLGRGVPSIVVDLGQTILLSGKAIEWLLDLDCRCGELGGSLIVTGANDLTAEALLITGASERLQIVSDVTRAIGRFAV